MLCGPEPSFCSLTQFSLSNKYVWSLSGLLTLLDSWKRLRYSSYIAWKYIHEAGSIILYSLLAVSLSVYIYFVFVVTVWILQSSTPTNLDCK
jgi:hypothetical protein